MIEGTPTLRGEGILYRSAPLPLSDGAAIDHVLGAANYRSLREDEALTTQVIFFGAFALGSGFLSYQSLWLRSKGRQRP
jgi:hypothetical protein